MDRKIIWQWVGCFILLAAVMASSCKGGNIFGFRGGANDNAGDLITEGQELLRNNKFEEAQAKFALAIAADSLNGDARFYHAKATLLASGTSIVQLLRDVTTDAQRVGGQIPLYSPDPLLPKEVDEANKTRLYRAAITIVQDLDPISRGLTHGTFDSSSVGLDLAVANTIRGILQLRDTNQNLEIKTPPDFFFDIVRLNNQDYGFGDLAEAILPASATAEEKAANIQNFNEVIRDLARGDSENTSIVQQILENLRQAGLLGEDSAINVDELEDVVNELGDSATYFFINNGVPGNDGEGDNDRDSRVDEEILDGVDNDGDGLIDEDAHYP